MATPPLFLAPAQNLLAAPQPEASSHEASAASAAVHSTAQVPTGTPSGDLIGPFALENAFAIPTTKLCSAAGLALVAYQLTD